MCTRKKSSLLQKVPLFCSNNHPSKTEKVQEIYWSELYLSCICRTYWLQILCCNFTIVWHSQVWSFVKISSLGSVEVGVRNLFTHIFYCSRELFTVHWDLLTGAHHNTPVKNQIHLCCFLRSLHLYSGWQEHFDSWCTLPSELSYGMELPEASNDLILFVQERAWKHHCHVFCRGTYPPAPRIAYWMSLFYLICYVSITLFSLM